jgi:hypothetical protein
MTPRSPTLPLNRRAALLVLAGGAAQLAACGGGGGDAGDNGTDTAGPGSTSTTGSFTTGTVMGLGSIMVNGIRYDDSRANIRRNDGGTVSGLRLGMVVAISGSAMRAALGTGTLPTATADRISFGSEWAGRIEFIDSLTRTFRLMGQTVEVLANTVFDGIGVRQLANLSTSLNAEVYGHLDLATSRLQATRVEASSAPASGFRLSGRVSGLDTTLRTFLLGGATISYFTIPVPAELANGSLVRVRLNPSSIGSLWTATRVELRSSGLAEVEAEDRADARVQGTITGITSAGSFSVNGIPINANNATISGTPGLGVNVEVTGVVRNESIVATSVVTRSDFEVGTQPFEVNGVVSSLDTGSRSFTLQGLAFIYTSSTRLRVNGWVTGATPLVRVTASLINGQLVASDIQRGSAIPAQEPV